MNKSVVITGSTRGIGYSLAEAFLERGCGVVISGRSSGAVNQVISKLAGSYTADLLYGFACDVTDFIQVKAYGKTPVLILAGLTSGSTMPELHLPWRNSGSFHLANILMW
jgi:NADP-dependent 3-hydroxy acid dehydrogenase YdfG